MIGPMAEERWEQLVEGAVGGPVSRGSMFGCAGLRTGTKFFALWWEERLVLKPSPDRLRQLVAAGRAEPFEPMPGRPMNGWVVVGDDADWGPLVDEARTFVESLQK
jgi:TfoX/Sxy family transcriptional regulator of competence genes